MKATESCLLFVLLATLFCESLGFTTYVTLILPSTEERSHEEVADTSFQTKTGLRLSALKPDLEILRELWLHNPNETRDGRIQLFENRVTSIQIVVKFAPKLFNDEYWQEDFLMIEFIGFGDFNTTSIFYKSGTFYARRDAVFEQIPDEGFVPVLSIAGGISESTNYLEIEYATLDTIATAVDQQAFALGFNFIEKISSFFAIDLSLIFLENLIVLPREIEGAYFYKTDEYVDKYNNILDGAHHKIVRYDRKRKTFYTKTNQALDGSYFARTAHLCCHSGMTFEISVAITHRSTL